MAKTNLSIVLALVSGCGLAFSLPFFQAGWLVFFAFIPLLLALSISNLNKSFLLGFLSGAVYFGFTFRWFWDAYPLKALGVESSAWAFGILLFMWLATALSMALFWGLAAFLFKKIETRFTWTSLLIFPAIFTLLEYFRSFFMGLLWFAPGAALGPHWTAGNVAYNLFASPFALGISSLLGIYGLTFLITLLNILLFLFLEQRRWMRLVGTLGLTLLIAYLPLQKIYQSRYPEERVSAAIIQTRTTSQVSPSTEDQLATLRRQLELLDKVSKEHSATSLVIFPEGSNFFTNLSRLGNTLSLSQYFSKLFPKAILILDNSKIQEEGSLKSKTIFLNSKEGIAGYYDKYLLTPGGEFVPSAIRRLDQVLALDSVALREVEEFKKGEAYPIPLGLGDFSVLSLVCSDISSPELAKPTSSAPADILSVQSSFGFVNGSSDLFSQTKAMAKFRAAENQRSLVFASNFGPSFMLFPDGSTSQETTGTDFEILTGPLVLNKAKTLYNKTGDGPILMASLSVLITSFFWKKKDSL
ncbi:MAG: nitrilase-related carbon-nitrogen hydrolase [bacterium]|nr:nitrilase-related carbon-nitrogen hydrolase [bacterium]